MLNPFELNGPEFLLFYLLFGLLVVFWLNYAINQFDSSYPAPTALFASDPYRIAWLRAGASEALEIATLSLVDRGVLKEDNGKLQLERRFSATPMRRPIEQFIVNHFARQTRPQPPLHVFWSPPELLEIKHSLQQHGLMRSPALLAKRIPLAVLAWALLLGASGLRLTLSAQHGHGNIAFLIILTLLFAVYSLLLMLKQTRRSKTYLKELESQFQRLKQRADSIPAGGDSNEMALLAALFGVSMLPLATFPWRERLYPTPQAGDGGGGDGSSDGISSDSSSDSGGGCGGGSCGGGCGGGD